MLLQIYVSFAEYSLFYRTVLQKRPINLRSLLIVGTPKAYLIDVRYVDSIYMGHGGTHE